MKSSQLFDIALLVVTALCIVGSLAVATNPLEFIAGICFGSSLSMSIHRICKHGD